MSPMEARKLLSKIKATLKSETVKKMIKEGYVFDGLIATGSAAASTTLLYKVIDILSYKAFCAKVYPWTNKNTFETEINASNMIHKKSIIPQIVHYTQLSFCHSIDGSNGLGLLMPLYKMSLSEILQANHDTPVPWHHFTKIAKELLYAGHIFQSHGYAHCDIKPGNIMMNDDGSPVLIDLGAVTKLGQSCTEYTRFYFLDSKSNAVDSTFDLNCIIVTLVQCFLDEFNFKCTNRKDLKNILAEQSGDLKKYADLCLKLLELDSCEQGNALNFTSDS